MPEFMHSVILDAYVKISHEWEFCQVQTLFAMEGAEVTLSIAGGLSFLKASVTMAMPLSELRSSTPTNVHIWWLSYLQKIYSIWSIFDIEYLNILYTVWVWEILFILCVCVYAHVYWCTCVCVYVCVEDRGQLQKSFLGGYHCFWDGISHSCGAYQVG